MLALVVIILIEFALPARSPGAYRRTAEKNRARARARARLRLSPEVAVFGERLADVTYVDRPGAYAVILDDHGLQQGQLQTVRVAVLETAEGCFLPGGGSVPGETSERTLEREAIEECGARLRIRRRVGEAVEYLDAVAREGCHYRIHSTFFDASFVADGSAVDDAVVWLDLATAMSRLRRGSQAWGVVLALRAALTAAPE